MTIDEFSTLTKRYSIAVIILITSLFFIIGYFIPADDNFIKIAVSLLGSVFTFLLIMWGIVSIMISEGSYDSSDMQAKDGFIISILGAISFISEYEMIDNEAIYAFGIAAPSVVFISAAVFNSISYIAIALIFTILLWKIFLKKVTKSKGC